MKHKVRAEEAPTYRAVMRGMEAFGEHAAPEVFKWVGWAVAMAAIEVVRRRTGADWLLILQCVLALLVLARITWRLSPDRAPETEEPDGGITFELAPKGMLWSLMVSIMCWLIMLTLTLGLVSLIADSELLAEKPAATLTQ